MDDQSEARMPNACRTCAKAKVRCEPELNGACKRCRRLNKECSGQAPGAHRRQRPTSSNLEVAALEAKLDRMVALLASEQSAKEATLNTSPGQSSTAYSGDAATPSEHEAQSFMEIFSTRMVPLFPFVVVPAHMTAEQLRQEKPFLYLNISVVACQDASRQREILGVVREYVAEHIVLRGEHNLDLLQGLMVHLAWYISVSRVPRSNVPGQTAETGNADLSPQNLVQGSAQLDVFLQLAVAQVISLGLNQGLASMKSLDHPLAYMRATDLHQDQTPPRTLDERRAYLGCYYLTMMLTACVRDVEPLRFTRYSQECCQVLLETSELPTDAYLVQLIKVVHLADRIVHTISLNNLDLPIILSAPLGVSIKSFQVELQNLRASFASECPYSIILSFHYDSLEVILYRIALSQDLSEPPYGDSPVTRIDLLFRCLEANKSFFYHFYSLPAIYFPFFPFTLWCQFGQGLMTMSRLLLHQDSTGGWDQTYVSSILDLDQTVDGLRQKLDEAQSLIDQGRAGHSATGEQPEIFSRLSARTRLIKELHSKRREKQAQAQVQAPALQEPLDFSFMFNMPFDPFFPYGDLNNFPPVLDAPMGL